MPKITLTGAAAQLPAANDIAHHLTKIPDTAPRRPDGTPKTAQEVTLCILAGHAIGLPPMHAAWDLQQRPDGFSASYAVMQHLMDAAATYDYRARFPADLPDDGPVEVTAYVKTKGLPVRIVDPEDPALGINETKELATMTVTVSRQDGTPPKPEGLARAARIAIVQLFCDTEPCLTGPIVNCHDAYEDAPDARPEWRNMVTAGRRKALLGLIDRTPQDRQKVLENILLSAGGLTAVSSSPTFYGVIDQMEDTAARLETERTPRIHRRPQ